MARKLSDQEVKDLAADIISSTPELKKLPTDELKGWLDRYKIQYDDEDIKALEEELIGFYGLNTNESNGATDQAKLKELRIPVYKDLDTGELCYFTMKGDGTVSLYDLHGTELANEKSRGEIKKSYNLEMVSESDDEMFPTEFEDGEEYIFTVGNRNSTDDFYVHFSDNKPTEIYTDQDSQPQGLDISKWSKSGVYVKCRLDELEATWEWIKDNAVSMNNESKVNESKGPVISISESLRSMVMNESNASMYGTPVSKPGDLVKDQTYTWCGGAELMPIKYVGLAVKNPDKKPGSSMGKGFLFQTDDGRYMELSMNAIRDNVIIEEELVEAKTKNLSKQDKLSSEEYQRAKKSKNFDKSKYVWDEKQDLYVKKEVNEAGRKSIKDFPFVMHWSDGMRQAEGGNTYMDLIKKAKEKKLKEFAIFKQAAGFHSTTQDEFLVGWYDEDGHNYWSNRAKKEPDLNDRKVIANDGSGKTGASESVMEGTWAENKDGNMEMYLGNKEGVIYILPNEDGTFDVYHDMHESGKEDYKVDTGLQTVEDAQEAARSYAENHLGIDINEASDTDTYNLDVKVKHDWTTDLGNDIKAGETVNIDVVEKSPGSTWNLISVRRKGKHLGYVESEHWHTMFDVIGKSKYSPEYEPESVEEAKDEEADKQYAIDVVKKLFASIYNMRPKDRVQLFEEILKVPAGNMRDRTKVAADILSKSPIQYKKALKTIHPKLYKSIYEVETPKRFPMIAECNEEGEITINPLFEAIKNPKFKLEKIKITNEFEEDDLPCINATAYINNKRYKFSDWYLEHKTVKKYHLAEAGDRGAMQGIRNRLTRLGNEFIKEHKNLQRELHAAKINEEAAMAKNEAKDKIQQMFDAIKKLDDTKHGDKKEIKRLEAEIAKLSKENGFTVDEIAAFEAAGSGPGVTAKLINQLADAIDKSDLDEFEMTNVTDDLGPNGTSYGFRVTKYGDEDIDYEVIDHKGAVALYRPETSEFIVPKVDSIDDILPIIKGEVTEVTEAAKIDKAYITKELKDFNAGTTDFDTMFNNIVAHIRLEDENAKETLYQHLGDSMNDHGDKINTNAHEVLQYAGLIGLNEAEDTEYFEVESKLRDVCFQQSQQQISNDEAVKQIQEILKDSEELSAVFTDVAPEALVDEVINYYGWTQSDLAEAKQEPNEGAITDEVDARFKQICADYYADLLPTADAIEQSKAVLDECNESHPELVDACAGCDDEELMYIIASHFGWNAFDLAESVKK